MFYKPKLNIGDENIGYNWWWERSRGDLPFRLEYIFRLGEKEEKKMLYIVTEVNTQEIRGKLKGRDS